MKTLRRCAIAVAVVLAFGAVLYAKPEWTEQLGLDHPNLSETLQAFQDEPARADALAQQWNVYEARIQGKERILGQLIEGRTPLPEAAAALRTLYETHGGTLGHYQKAGATATDSPGEDSEEARLYREVIGRARDQAAASAPDKAEAVAQRLEAELKGLLRGGGKDF
jgi:hypothetical protein